MTSPGEPTMLVECRSRVSGPRSCFDRVSASALALLVASVAVADDHHATVTANHLAVLADPLDAGLNLHCCPAFSSTAPRSGRTTRNWCRAPYRSCELRPIVPGPVPGPPLSRGWPSLLVLLTLCLLPTTCSGRRSDRARGRRAKAPRPRGPPAGCGCSAAASCR